MIELARRRSAGLLSCCIADF